MKIKIKQFLLGKFEINQHNQIEISLLDLNLEIKTQLNTFYSLFSKKLNFDIKTLIPTIKLLFTFEELDLANGKPVIKLQNSYFDIQIKNLTNTQCSNKLVCSFMYMESIGNIMQKETSKLLKEIVNNKVTDIMNKMID